MFSRDSKILVTTRSFLPSVEATLWSATDLRILKDLRWVSPVGKQYLGHARTMAFSADGKTLAVTAYQNGYRKYKNSKIHDCYLKFNQVNLWSAESGGHQAINGCGNNGAAARALAAPKR